MIENNTNNVQTYIPIHDVYHKHTKYESTVERAKQLFLDGYLLSVSLSGKDSGAASVCVVEGLRRAKLENPNVGPLYFVTTNTTLDNMVLHEFMMQLHEDVYAYGKEHDLPIFTKQLKPALSSNPMVEMIGRGKLLRTPETTSKGRDCAVSWKVLPMKKYMKELERSYQTSKVVNISGSRQEESRARSANLLKRKESAFKMVKTDLGFSLPIIMDWTLSDVWSLFSEIDLGDIETYSEHFSLMRKHYSSGNGGVCDLFAGNLKSTEKSCGARFGCVLCGLSGPTDKSLEAQISTDEKTYGFMKPLNELRTFMLNTLWDFNNRSLTGKEMKDGFIKVGVNHYNLSYRIKLLRYVLTIQHQAYQRFGYHPIDLIDYEELLAIQYHWSRDVGEPEPGFAFKIWHEIVENESNFYPIPDTTYTPQSPIPGYLYFDLQSYVNSDYNEGLDDKGLDGELRSIARCYERDGIKQRVVRYTENQQFKVVLENSFAMMFVTSYYPSLVEDGHLDGKCPSVMLKHLLESGVIEISKGSISRLHNDALRSQTLNSLRTMSGIPVDQLMLSLSVSKRIRDEIVAQRKLENSNQQSLF